MVNDVGAAGPLSVFAGRQAIFAGTAVFGYELLYRSSAENVAVYADEDTATHALLRTVLLDIGLEGLVGSKPAFVKVPKSFLANDLYHALPADRVVLEVRENDASGPDLQVLVALARRQGYRVALEGFRGTELPGPLVDQVDFVKVDLTKRPLDESLDLAAALRKRGVQVVAEKVETLEQQERCTGLFDLMQGYFFQRPVVVEGEGLATDRLATLGLLAEYARPDATLEDFENVISRDPALTFRVLQLANSSYMGLPRRVESLREALVYLGVRNVRNLTLIASLNRVEDKPAQLVTSALIRAKVCEQMAISEGLKGPAAFTAGLLSLVDVFTGIPLEEALERLSLGDHLEEAILHQTGPYGWALRAAIACDLASVEDLEAARVGIDAASAAFRTAVHWADAMMV